MLSQLHLSPHCDIGQVRSGVMGRVYNDSVCEGCNLYVRCYFTGLGVVNDSVDSLRSDKLRSLAK